jgi:indoleamine 2,3-dioxygenase
LDADAKVFRGTGGTNVMPFLKQSRDETADMKIRLGEATKEVVTPSNTSSSESLSGQTKEDKQSWSDWILRR